MWWNRDRSLLATDYLARRLRTVAATYSTAKSISASVLYRPRPKRRLALACSSLSPRASSTWLGSGLGALAAAPGGGAGNGRAAGRPGADGDLTQAGHQGLAVHAGESDVEISGQAPGRNRD